MIRRPLSAPLAALLCLACADDAATPEHEVEDAAPPDAAQPDPAPSEPACLRFEEGPIEEIHRGPIVLGLAAHATERGLLVAWREAGAAPNGYAMLVGEEPFELAGGHVSEGPRMWPGADGVTVLGFCAGFGGENRAATVHLDAAGSITRPLERREPSDRSCGAAAPEGIFTGQRHLFAWTDNSSGPIQGHEMLVETASAAGESLDWVQLYDEGDLSAPPRWSRNGDNILMVAGVRVDEPRLAIHRYHPLGEQLSSVRMPERWTHVELAPIHGLNRQPGSGDGWVAAMRGEEGGALMKINRAGQPERPQFIMDTQSAFRVEALTAYPGGALLLGADIQKRHVIWLDAAGDVAERSVPEGQADFGHAAATWDGERMHLVWSHPLSEDEQQILMRTLNCAARSSD